MTIHEPLTALDRIVMTSGVFEVIWFDFCRHRMNRELRCNSGTVQPLCAAEQLFDEKPSRGGFSSGSCDWLLLLLKCHCSRQWFLPLRMRRLTS